MTYIVYDNNDEIYCISDKYPRGDTFFVRLSKYCYPSRAFEMHIEMEHFKHAWVYYDTLDEGMKDFDWIVEEYCRGAIRE